MSDATCSLFFSLRVALQAVGLPGDGTSEISR